MTADAQESRGAVASRIAPDLFHNIPREEWERRFRDQIKLRLGADVREEILSAELETWALHDGSLDPDWKWNLPEDAANDNLSYWTD